MALQNSVVYYVCIWYQIVKYSKHIFFQQLKEQASDSIMVLEGVLAIKKDFYIHTLRTLDLLAADPSTANGETESSTAGLCISADELHCQVRYLSGVA